MKTKKAPGKANREGISLLKIMEMFPTEKAAQKWFESTCWPTERGCGHCGSTRTHKAKHRYMPYRCTDCRQYFSVRTGTALANSKVPLRKWVIAIYLEQTSLKSISSMKLHRDIEVSQPTAWFMLHRIREAWKEPNGNPPLGGPVEVDETYFGGKRRNMSERKRRTLDGRGAKGKTAVVGIKDRESNQVRAKVIERTDGPTLHGFIRENAQEGARIYTDEALVYEGVPNRQAVKHSVKEYVRGMAHTNGIESFWAVLKRAHKGTFHKISPKHLDRYVREFAGKHNFRHLDTRDQMASVVAALIGKRLLRRDLVASNGLSAAAR